MLESFFFVLSGYHFPRLSGFPANFVSGHSMKNDNFSLSISRGNCSVVMERGGKDLIFSIDAVGAVN